MDLLSIGLYHKKTSSWNMMYADVLLAELEMLHAGLSWMQDSGLGIGGFGLGGRVFAPTFAVRAKLASGCQEYVLASPLEFLEAATMSRVPELNPGPEPEALHKHSSQIPAVGNGSDEICSRRIQREGASCLFEGAKILNGQRRSCVAQECLGTLASSAGRQFFVAGRLLAPQEQLGRSHSGSDSPLCTIFHVMRGFARSNCQN